MENVDKFDKHAREIAELGETTLIISLEKKYGGSVRALLHGTADSLMFAMAGVIYQIHQKHDIPLEDIGDMLNHYMTETQKLDKEGRICDSNT